METVIEGDVKYMNIKTPAGNLQDKYVHTPVGDTWFLKEHSVKDIDIVQYQIEENGMLTKACNFSCGGKGPRNFAVCEKYLLCANQLSDSVTVFALNASGGPERVTDVYPMYSPTFVMLL